MLKKINITGGIGFDFTGDNFREQINGFAGDIELHINSPGGDIYDGIEIYNEIKRYQRETGSKVTAFLSGFVASAASYLSMAASERVAYDNSVFMIHNASMIVMGDAGVFEFWSDDLKKTDALIARAYSKVSGKSDKDIRELMSAGKDNNGTYFYGEEIEESGFADRVIDSDEGGDKDNKTKESKVLFANFKRNVKPKEYDHERIVALVNNKENKGDVMGKREEALLTLKNLKANAEITLLDVADEMGLKDQVITDAQKQNLAKMNAVKDLCGETDPVDFINGLLDEKKENAGSVREARLTELFGAKEVEGKENQVRTFAETMIGEKEITDEEVTAVKENSIFKTLASDQADVNSDFNRIGESERKENGVGDEPVQVEV